MVQERSGKGGGGRGRVGTRDRVLAVTLSLFNERGPDRVTTAEIARAVEINEGNLYYHFKTKEALILALFAMFEADCADLVGSATEAPPGEIGTYADFLRRWFSLAWAYRFLFRDLLGLVAATPALGAPIRSVSAEMRGVVGGLLDAMEAGGFIDVPPEEKPPLLANVWIVATYWAVYLSLQEGVEKLDETHLDWGLNQVVSLFRPYLSETAKAELPA